jgi:hypothetical protein
MTGGLREGLGTSTFGHTFAHALSANMRSSHKPLEPLCRWRFWSSMPHQGGHAHTARGFATEQAAWFGPNTPKSNQKKAAGTTSDHAVAGGVWAETSQERMRKERGRSATRQHAHPSSPLISRLAPPANYRHCSKGLARRYVTHFERANSSVLPS